MRRPPRGGVGGKGCPRLFPSLIRVLGERAPCACPAAELLIKLHRGEAQRRRGECARRPESNLNSGVHMRYLWDIFIKHWNISCVHKLAPSALETRNDLNQ
ncbi:mothers against decapentaplegic homolog 5 isoform X3 [Myotis daubentonii]|uniref:mothers against decapentaplegic homolog 5 isoform X3 n=1 Tax=Myotis daubentonii TaxID=98922 RepID=UPI0028733950|nr:mothers against decapentaplegic homolog 5 isoform X3 [Myotis daubentonii]